MDKEELIYFVQHGLALTDEQRAAYASQGAFQKILIDFFDGFDKLLDKICDKEKLELIEYVDSIWDKYDLDGSNAIDAKEVKQLIVDITGHDNVPDLNCVQFVEHIESQSEGDNNGEIEKDELLCFIEDGIALSSAERKEFGSRGVFHKMLVDFFIGIDEARYRFKGKKQINVNKRDQTEDASQEEENTYHPDEARLLNLAIDSIWNDYDADGSNTIDADEAKQMIVDITGNKKVSKRDVRDFIAHIEKEAFEATGQKPNGVLEKEELIYFVQHGLALTDEQRAAYASRGAFQKILIDFFDGFDKLLDKIKGKNVKISVIKLKMHHKKKKIRTILTRRDF